jgi:hypothetical protein
VVKHLLRKSKTLNSNPSTAKKIYLRMNVSLCSGHLVHSIILTITVLTSFGSRDTKSGQFTKFGS